ncbi:MAG: type II toxin-antitoxin system VapC family toxin [Pirellulales bacterium]
MPLDDIPAGATVFVDSTILHYAFVHFEAATPQCIRLLQRVGKGELAACLTLPVLNDAVHKVMCSEAMERFNRPRAGLVGWMGRNPASVRELVRASDFLNLIGGLPIRILSADLEALIGAQRMVRAHGLLASDSLIVALMQSHSITHLATNDDDFDRVPGITVWKPRL